MTFSFGMPVKAHCGFHPLTCRYESTIDSMTSQQTRQVACTIAFVCFNAINVNACKSANCAGNAERGYIDPARWCVAVGSPPPGCAVAAKGTGAHWLKGDASWVQNVVRQFGHYLQKVLVV